MVLIEETWGEFDVQLAVSLGGNSTSEIFYERLNNLTGLNEYYAYCEPLKSHKNMSAVKNVCAKILKYLSSNEELRSNSNVYDICRLLNYWVATKLSAIGFLSDSSYMKNVFLDISLIWNTYIANELNNDHHQTCNPLINVVTIRDWRMRKALYDYYVDYVYLDNMASIIPNADEYCKYIRNKVSLYEYFGSKCFSDQTDFCHEFKTKYKACDPNELLLKFKCVKEVKKKKLLEESQRIKTHQGVSSERNISEQERQSPGLSTEGTHTLKDLQSISNSFSHLKNAGGILLGIVAISMTYVFLHKFTPLGILIHNKFASKNYNRSNINSEFNIAFDYAQEIHNPHYNIRDEHYIGYHSD
ncbi:variable surface protein [Plasmodium gonderi]|uniref:Variable surface protein n=1 Tax=Plasmodium gonderi TaxID=77519 RepID=A0A1Y1JPD4_PLAGO|nr:variable surface protein [Plasmodium gonderi]GAW84351.1 variable surface protein [Plasmodium gonderi]